MAKTLTGRFEYFPDGGTKQPYVKRDGDTVLPCMECSRPTTIAPSHPVGVGIICEQCSFRFTTILEAK